MDNSKIIQGLDLASPNMNELGLLELQRVQQMTYYQELTNRMQKKARNMFLPTMYVDTEGEFDQEILEKLGLKREPDPGMHDVRELMTLTGRYTPALPSCIGFPKFNSSSLPKSSIESTHSTLNEEGTEIMHSPAMFRKFAVNVRPATHQDKEKLYSTITDSYPEYKKGEADPGVNQVPLSGDWSGAHLPLDTLMPLLVFEFVGDLKEASLILMGTTSTNNMAQKNAKFAFQFFHLHKSHYGQPLTCPVLSRYDSQLSHIKNDLRRALHARDPENNNFSQWYVKWDKVVEAFADKGLEGIYPTKKEMDMFRRRVKPLSSEQPFRSCQVLVGYLFAEMFLMNKDRGFWPKDVNTLVYHKLFKALVGHRFMVGHAQQEDWWAYPSVGELVFV